VSSLKYTPWLGGRWPDGGGVSLKWPESERIDKNDYEEGQNRERGEKCSSMCSS